MGTRYKIRLKKRVMTGPWPTSNVLAMEQNQAQEKESSRGHGQRWCHHYRPTRQWYGAKIIAILYALPLVHRTGGGKNSPQNVQPLHVVAKCAPADQVRFALLDWGFAPRLGLNSQAAGNSAVTLAQVIDEKLVTLHAVCIAWRSRKPGKYTGQKCQFGTLHTWHIVQLVTLV